MNNTKQIKLMILSLFVILFVFAVWILGYIITGAMSTYVWIIGYLNIIIHLILIYYIFFSKEEPI
jgi:membrane protein CcdC involved in cytochrome C biogenesis